MFKFSIILTYFFLCLSYVYSQTATQTDYSESKSYQPKQNPNPNSKKLKKSKKSDRENDSQTVKSSIVKIPVFVSDKDNNPVRNLVSSDFKLLIKGSELEILSFEEVRNPLEIRLILDTSPSAANQQKEIGNDKLDSL